MKRIIFLVVILFTSNILHSQTKKEEKEFLKMIMKYDMKDLILSDSLSRDANIFWKSVMKDNRNYRVFFGKYNFIPKGKSKRKLISEYYEYASNLEKEFSDVGNEYLLGDSLHESIIDFIAGKESKLIWERPRKIMIDFSDVPNAYAAPGGFLFVTSGLLSLMNDIDCIYGVLAHEMAHFILCHGVVNKHNEKVNKRKNRILAGLAVAATSFSAAAVQARGGMSQKDSEELWENVNKANQSYVYAADYASEKYGFRYSREQEIEADIMAYRFLQYMGMDPNWYIVVLQKLQKANPSYYTSVYDTHPSSKFRIDLLKYLQKLDEAGVDIGSYKDELDLRPTYKKISSLLKKYN